MSHSVLHVKLWDILPDLVHAVFCHAAKLTKHM